MPKLIGMISLPFPKVIRKPTHDNPGTYYASRIAFDEEGRAWALVELMIKIGDRADFDLRRISFAGWQAVKPIPFVYDNPIELFEEDPGEEAERPPGRTLRPL